MYQAILLTLEILAILWLFNQLHKHDHRFFNWIRAVALMLLISHCGLLILNGQETANARRISPDFLHQRR